MGPGRVRLPEHPTMQKPIILSAAFLLVIACSNGASESTPKAVIADLEVVERPKPPAEMGNAAAGGFWCPFFQSNKNCCHGNRKDQRRHQRMLHSQHTEQNHPYVFCLFETDSEHNRDQPGKDTEQN